MISGSEIETTTELTKLAIQYGPFAFSMLFLIVIPPLAHKWYRDANRRTNPPATLSERNTYRFYFLGTFVFGLVLVTVSVTWWIFGAPANYVFQGVIANLRDTQKLETQHEFFYQIEKKERPFDAGPERRDKRFQLVRHEPFQVGDTFRFDLWLGVKGREDTARKLLLVYTSESTPVYRVEYEDDKDQYILKRDTPTKQVTPKGQTGFDGLVVNFARASQDEAYLQKKSPSIQVAESELLLEPVPGQPGLCEHMTLKVIVRCPTETGWSETNAPSAQIRQDVILLQNERSDISSKIHALNVLLKLSEFDLDLVLVEQHTNEPFSLTLYDLTRHTNPEIAAKSRRLVQQLDLQGRLAGQLKNINESEFAQAEDIVFRLDRSTAEDIIDEAIGLGGEKIDLESLRDRIKAGDETRTLFPTESAEGDRYYVKAAWDRGNSDTVNCLTELFNRQLRTKRTLDQEKELMAERSSRYVYWYSKEWSLSIAERIEKCGASASFLGF